MKVNPVLKKELIVNTRTVKIMAVSAVLNICFSIMVLLFLYEEINSKPSSRVFDYKDANQLIQISVGILMLFTILFILWLSAKSVASEKEKQNIELMLISPYHPFKIIFGKLIAIIVMYFMVLIAALPVIALAWIMGKITGVLAIQILLLLTGTAVLAGSIGIFFSTVMKTVITSFVWSSAVISFFSLGIILIYRLCGYNLWETAGMKEPTILFLGNPVISFLYLLTGRGSLMLNSGHVLKTWFLWSIFVQFLLSGILLFLSSLFFKSFQSGKIIKNGKDISK